MSNNPTPVADLQKMLRTVSKGCRQIPCIAVDGLYGPTTGEAVAAFQKYVGLTPTGITDEETWNLLYREYKREKRAQSSPTPVAPADVKEKGSGATLCRDMLCTLCRDMRIAEPPTPGDTWDSASARALQSFQRLCRLPSTGIPDKITWHHLVRQYESCLHRQEEKD